MRLSKLLILVAFLFTVGCVEGPTTGDVTYDTSSETSSDQRVAALQDASPSDGSVVVGEFVLAAVVNGDATVRFILNGRQVAELDTPPYQVGMDGCDMSSGNHFFVVELEGANGDIQDREQWFTVEACE